jgi:hypothetical protein
VESPCWTCDHQELEGSFSCRAYAQASESTGFIPVIHTAAATLAAFMAEDIIQILHGNASHAFERIFLDVRLAESSRVKLVGDPACPGIHRRLISDVTTTDVSSDQPLSLLAEQLALLHGPGMSIVLPELFVETASCKRCGRSIRVLDTVSKWSVNPACKACGGRFPGSRRAGVSTFQFLPASADGLKNLYKLPARRFGLVPGKIFEVHGPSGTARVRMPGSVLRKRFNHGRHSCQ